LCVRACVRACVCMPVLVTTVSPAKMAEPIEMPFSGNARMAPKNHLLYGYIHIGATWQIRLNNPCAATMRAVATNTLVTMIRYVLPVVDDVTFSHPGTSDTNRATLKVTHQGQHRGGQSLICCETNGEHAVTAKKTSVE